MKKIILFLALFIGVLSVDAQTDLTYSSLNDLSGYDSTTVIHEGEELYTIVNNDSVAYNFINDTLTSVWLSVENYEYYFDAYGKMRYYTYIEGNNQYCYFFESETYLDFIYYPTTLINDYEKGFGGFIVGGTYYTYFAGYTGNASLNTDNCIGSGIKWRFIVPKSGNYQVTWRYSAVGGKPAEVCVNGCDIITSVAFASTGSFATWEEQTCTIYLEGGLNIIKLTAIRSTGLGLIDCIELQSPDGSLAEPYREYSGRVGYAFNEQDIEGFCESATDSIFIVVDSRQYSEGITDLFSTNFSSSYGDSITLSGSGSAGDHIHIMPCNFDNNVYLDCDITLSGDITITGEYIKFTGVTLTGKIEFK